MMSLRLFACCSVGLCAFQAVAVPLKVACIGDSITEGSGLGSPATESYPAKLGRLLGPDYQVRNFGVSSTTLLKKGDYPYWSTTAYRQSHDYAPDVVIIKLGTNDSKPQNWRYSTNYIPDYETLIATYTNLPSCPRIVLVTPCPVYGNGAFSIRPGVVRTNIAPAVRDLAAQLGCDLIDLHTRMDGHQEWFPDTVHPNSKGTTVMAAIVRTALAGNRPSSTPAALAIDRAATRAVLRWPAEWAGMVLQSNNGFRTTNSPWTVVEQIAGNDGALVRVTNTISGAAKFYRLWRP